MSTKHLNGLFLCASMQTSWLSLLKLLKERRLQIKPLNTLLLLIAAFKEKRKSYNWSSEREVKVNNIKRSPWTVITIIMYFFLLLKKNLKTITYAFATSRSTYISIFSERRNYLFILIWAEELHLHWTNMRLLFSEDTNS